MKKVIFFNVDTQVDFIEPNGKLAIKGATEIKENLRKLTEIAEDNNILVVNTADCHNKDSKELSDTPDFINTFPKHCMRLTDGFNFIKETNPNGEVIVFDWEDHSFLKFTLIDGIINFDIRNIIITKDAFDIFTGHPASDRIIKNIDPKYAIAYGITTNVCVNYAVLGLAKRGVQVIVVVDAVKELPNLPLKELVREWINHGVTFAAVDNKNLEDNAIIKAVKELGTEPMAKVLGEDLLSKAENINDVLYRIFHEDEELK
jgi:nicotinamidase/pyrazinamidase